MSHAFKALYFHCIWATAERQPLISSETKLRLYPYITGIAKNNDCSVLEVGGTQDHIHILLQSSKFDLTDCIRNMKACSSGWIHKNFPDLAIFKWQKGSAVFSVSYSMIDDVRKYIQNQEQHHAQCSFEQEFRKFLKHHKIDYDERDVFG